MEFEKVFAFFLPRDRKFFTLFTQSSTNLVDIAGVFNELINTTNPDKRRELTKKIMDLEHVGDNITHKLFTELGTNFITPFDREDIHYLASSMDDIADYIEGSAKRLEMYRVEEYTTPMKKLAELIEHSTKEIHIAMSNMRNVSNPIRIREAIVRINSLENHADDIFDAAIADLFLNEKDAVKVIKLKEILQNMETATDKCEDVANVIETILVKNS
jgi:predicted phosphate transport protein (TIGR00153 family)